MLKKKKKLGKNDDDAAAYQMSRSVCISFAGGKQWKQDNSYGNIWEQANL